MALHGPETIYAATPSDSETYESSDVDGLYYGILPTKIDELRPHMEIPDDRRVLYVGSGLDITPATYFGRDYVDHLDISPEVVETLQNHKYRAFEGFASHFETEPYDVVILVNTYTVDEPKLVQRLLKPGGYLIATPMPNIEAMAEEGRLDLVHSISATSENESFGPHFMDNQLLLLRKPEEITNGSELH